VSKKRIALVILAVIVVALAVAAVVIDTKYGVLFGSPRVRFDSLVKPETRAQLVVNVPLAKAIIKKQLLKGVNIPDSLLPYGLPYEAGLVMNMDYILGDMNLSLFVNDRRFGPIIKDKIDQFTLPKPLDQWFPNKMTWKQRGLLLREGVARMDRTLLANLKAEWKGPAPTEPLHAEGTHLLELVVDNRDGSAVAIAGTVAATQGYDVAEIFNPGRMGIVANIASMRLQADLTPENTLKVRLIVECTPQTDSPSVDIIKMMVDMGLGQIQGEFAKYGDVKTQTAVQGKSVTADITFPDADAVLSKLL
jgi:hypothetical protein